jgi:transcriptional regulator with XRE-family HTH domain
MDVDLKIKAEVKRYMQEHGITQRQLADKLGIKQPSVAAALGKTAAVNQGFIAQLDALGLELAVKTKDDEAEPMDAETKAWLEADLAPPLEPDAHGELDPMTVGRPVRYEAGRGLLVLESGE